MKSSRATKKKKEKKKQPRPPHSRKTPRDREALSTLSISLAPATISPLRTPSVPQEPPLNFLFDHLVFPPRRLSVSVTLPGGHCRVNGVARPSEPLRQGHADRTGQPQANRPTGRVDRPLSSRENLEPQPPALLFCFPLGTPTGEENGAPLACVRPTCSDNRRGFSFYFSR